MGTYVPSASWRLVWALASLKSADERITIEGFYDDVLPVTKKDEEILNAFPYNEKSQLEKLGLTSFLRGSSGLELKSRSIWSHPCQSAVWKPVSFTMEPEESCRTKHTRGSDFIWLRTSLRIRWKNSCGNI